MGRAGTLAVSLLLLAGCAKVAQEAGITEREMPVSGKGQVLPGTDVRASGFLGDYSQLVPTKGSPGEWEYVRKGVDWKPYTRIMMRPMEVWVNTGATIRPSRWTCTGRSKKRSARL